MHLTLSSARLSALSTRLAAAARALSTTSSPSSSSSSSSSSPSSSSSSSSSSSFPPPPAAAAAAGLALFRRILRAHRQKLPFHLRELGDRYVRDEFRKHAKADAKWLRGFAASWEEYAATLERQSAASAEGIGRALAPEQLRGLTDEQKNQLAALRYEAERAFAPPAEDGAEDEASGARR